MRTCEGWVLDHWFCAQQPGPAGPADRLRCLSDVFLSYWGLYDLHEALRILCIRIHMFKTTADISAWAVVNHLESVFLWPWRENPYQQKPKYHRLASKAAGFVPRFNNSSLPLSSWDVWMWHRAGKDPKNRWLCSDRRWRWLRQSE